MKIWLQSNGEILFKVSTGYARVFFYLYINKRLKIKEIDIISFASSLSYDFPTDFIAIYYTEEVRYWHELRKLVKIVCY